MSTICLIVLYNSDDEHSLYHMFTSDLIKRWDVEDEGEVSDLLNVEISRSNDGVTLRQTAYIEKLVDTWLLDGVPSTFHFNSAPHAEDLPTKVLEALSVSEPPDPELLRKYQSLVQALFSMRRRTLDRILLMSLVCFVVPWLGQVLLFLTRV